jgi:hypothetical protein
MFKIIDPLCIPKRVIDALEGGESERTENPNWEDAQRETVTDRLVKFIWDSDNAGSIDAGELKATVKDPDKLRQACREFINRLVDQ